MKRKQHSTQKLNTLKWHAVIYAAAMATVWYGVVATINYSGNTLVSLDEYRPLILQRIDFTLFWGILLLIHLGVSEVRDYYLQRDEHTQLDSILNTD